VLDYPGIAVRERACRRVPVSEPDRQELLTALTTEHFALQGALRTPPR
jgi:hypothetical protein